ncbi:hypothetical protein TDMWS_08130 [Thermodesulfomicrobium sp. WS]|uniref:hypothetical protein n=1 Tax=Thermodesulfomicrobium sp. WS TaxID=3004129 RepID=UPI0024902D1A|nr:hypothetical protein [Thermodesulfomicrobium sp. WS]BDV00728.1 hypothetical protein TDMWS_08130 [Thermodesulfomicrobium sp. WS]
MAPIPAWIHHYTPRAASRTRIMTAACFWSAVGFFLISKGGLLLRPQPWPAIMGTAVAGLGLGLAKSRLVFDRTARAVVAHIRRKPEPACLGGLFSIRNWGLIVAMMVLGRALGASPLPLEVRAGVFLVVGCGLLTSSRIMWRAWRATPATNLGDLRR